ncbi:MAG TPA: hypothetical protein VHL58_07165 [Thermoanaerobaculia bacterium]|nr:hypothetical protein [Thermoanaerobaculia bacterium]
MTKIALLLPASLVLLLFLGCSGNNDTPTEPGRGALTLIVNPNPIVATRVAGTSGTYDFPFEIVLTETGGRTVTLTALHVDVKTLGITVLSKTYDANYLRDHNYSPVIPAGTTARYSFNLREDAPDSIFSSNVEADLQAEGVDDKGNAVRQTKTVSVTRR